MEGADLEPAQGTSAEREAPGSGNAPDPHVTRSARAKGGSAEPGGSERAAPRASRQSRIVDGGFSAVVQAVHAAIRVNTVGASAALTAYQQNAAAISRINTTGASAALTAYQQNAAAISRINTTGVSAALTAYQQNAAAIPHINTTGVSAALTAYQQYAAAISRINTTGVSAALTAYPQYAAAISRINTTGVSAALTAYQQNAAAIPRINTTGVSAAVRLSRSIMQANTANLAAQLAMAAMPRLDVIPIATSLYALEPTSTIDATGLAAALNSAVRLRQTAQNPSPQESAGSSTADAGHLHARGKAEADSSDDRSDIEELLSGPLGATAQSRASQLLEELEKQQGRKWSKRERLFIQLYFSIAYAIAATLLITANGPTGALTQGALSILGSTDILIWTGAGQFYDWSTRKPPEERKDNTRPN